MNKSKLRLIFRMFVSMLLLSTFTFGGGYVIVSLMKKKFVDEYKWIDNDEMLDLVAIAQSSPGAIAVNGAVAIGYKLFGIAGIIIAAFATILPPFIIISLISMFYGLFASNEIISQLLFGMSAGVGAVIANVVFEMASRTILTVKESKSEPLEKFIPILLMPAAFIAALCGISSALIILTCAALGAVYAIITVRRNKK